MKRRLQLVFTIHFVFILIAVFAPRDAFGIQGQPTGKTSKAAELKILEQLEYQKAFFERKRDPILAGILSWYIPGLGQYYSGEITKGTVFMITEYTLTLGAILYFINFDFSAGGKTGFKINVDAKRSDLGVIETSRRNVFLGIISIVGIIHLYNISDAVRTARIFNMNLEHQQKKLRETYPFIFTKTNDMRSVYLGLQTRF
ncbi:MAG: hypothetical protein N2316_00365 [Spirochaetes bacterium]|nr:hypothetical protein [Spirochaetota bacterium]